VGEAKRRKALGLPAEKVPRSSRRQQARELTETWSVYHPLGSGPIRKKQIERLADEPPGTWVDEKGIVHKP
jgi:hypothetical protein